MVDLTVETVVEAVDTVVVEVTVAVTVVALAVVTVVIHKIEVEVDIKEEGEEETEGAVVAVEAEGVGAVETVIGRALILAVAIQIFLGELNVTNVVPLPLLARLLLLVVIVAAMMVAVIIEVGADAVMVAATIRVAVLVGDMGVIEEVGVAMMVGVVEELEVVVLMEATKEETVVVMVRVLQLRMGDLIIVTCNHLALMGLIRLMGPVLFLLLQATMVDQPHIHHPMVVVLLVMLAILCLITVVVLVVAQLVDMLLLLHRVKVVMVVLLLHRVKVVLLLMHLRRSSNVMKPVAYPVTMHVYTYQICLRM